MKKFLFAVAFVATSLFAQAITTVKTTNTSTTVNNPVEKIELQSNMVTSTTPLSADVVAANRLVYLGVYDVYVNGKYIGRYHVYLVTAN